MHLVYSTPEFKLVARPIAGFPILLWEDMRSCEPANAFLRYYLSRGAIGSIGSWEQIAQALYDYFGFLEAHHLSWNDTNRGEEKSLVAGYRDYSLDVSNLNQTTVRLRLTYICKFYKYAEHCKWISDLPFDYEERFHSQRQGAFLAHTDATGGKTPTPSVMPRAHRRLLKFLSKSQVKALLDLTTNVHHRMAIRMFLQTGLRRGELATFPLSYIFDPSKTRASARNVQVRLDPNDGSGMKTKGGHPRDITMTARLMKDLYLYAIHWRGERASQSSDKAMPLFLNQFGQPFAQDGKGFENIVRKIGIKAGFKTHPHMLRHTYATHTLVALQKHQEENGIEPIVFLMLQLGHASIVTTMKYTHIVNELADKAILAYDDELNDWAESSK